MRCNKKSNRPSANKRSLNKKKTNCSETVNNEKELPKCPMQKRPQATPKKCLTRTEKIILRIQPPIADREKYIHPEHINCFLEVSERVFMEHSEHRPLRSEQTKADGKVQRKKKIDKSKKTAGAVSDKKGEAETGKETAGEQNEKIKDEDEDKGKSEETKPKGRAEKDATKTKTEKNRKQKKSITEDSDSDISIRSIDSEVCAAGLALTKEDKKKIEENRRKVHPPPEKTDASAKADENI